MENFAYIEAIPNSNEIFISFFNKNLSYIKHEFLNISQNYLDTCQFLTEISKNYILLSYKFSNEYNLFYFDISVLCELKNIKHNNLNELFSFIFSDSEISKYNTLIEKIKAHFRSYRISKIDISKLSKTKILPLDLLENLYLERSKLIIKLYTKIYDSDVIKFYESFFDKMIILKSISKNKIHIDLNIIHNNNDHYSQSIKKFTNKSLTFLSFNPVGAKTGRISFYKNSINIYTLPKVLRKSFVAPQTFKIVQFDFKSFQPRLAIFNTSNKEFQNKFKNVLDIYSVFPGDREQNKISFLTWMYSNNRHDIFDREAFPVSELKQNVYKESINQGKIKNVFNRVLFFEKEKSNVVFQNYITSLEVDFMFEIMKKINDMLTNYKSKLIFPFYDALVFYVHEQEAFLVKKIKNIMETFFISFYETIFPVDVKYGENYFDLKKINI